MLTDDELHALDDLLREITRFRTGLKQFRDRSQNRNLRQMLIALYSTTDASFSDFSLQAHLLIEDRHEPL